MRLLSLDVLRGLTVAAMVLVNNPGHGPVTYGPLRHADWHGWTFADTIFPSFLFMVGISIVLSLDRRLHEGQDRATLLRHAAVRAAILFAVPLVLSLIPDLRFDTLRIPGVLQRIAVCGFAGTLICLYFGPRGRLIWLCGLLGLYWTLMRLYPVPGYGVGLVDQKIGNFAQYVDSMLLSGHLWSQTKVWDPEGIVSTLPAIGSVLFGAFAGQVLQSRQGTERKAVTLFLMGNGLLLLGLLMDPLLPVNKALWTVSFAVLMAGLTCSALGAAYWMIDGLNWRTGWTPLVMFGRNALAIFLLSGVFSRLMSITIATDSLGTVSLQRWMYQAVFLPMAAPPMASLLYALFNVAVMLVIAAVLYYRRWFWKL